MVLQLRIGEVAHLLNISTKTIRHYHKVGLLEEPPRAANGYRCYSVQDLLQLVRIRRLQRWGLPLLHIKHIFQLKHNSEHAAHQQIMRQSLTEVLTALDEEITRLQLRRATIATILSQSELDSDQPETIPAMLDQLQSRLLPPDSPGAAAIWQADQRIFGTLESLTLPDGYQREMAALADRALSDPAMYQRLFSMAEQLVALADIPEDSPLVEELVARACTEEWQSQLHALIPTETGAETADGIFHEVMFGLLSPAQRRFLTMLRERSTQA